MLRTEGEESSSTDIEDILESHKGSHSRKRSINPAAGGIYDTKPTGQKITPLIILKYIIIKPLNIWNKERILKVARNIK